MASVPMTLRLRWVFQGGDQHAPKDQLAAGKAEMCRGGFDGEVHDGKAERGNNHPCRAERIFSDGFHLMGM